MSFQELGLSAPLLRAVEAAGYRQPTPIQAAAIGHVLEGRDLCACAQTGTGKTAAFALPLLQRLAPEGGAPRKDRRAIRVLVLSPTRELAHQISDSFREYGRHTGLRQAVIYGGVSQRPQTRELQRGVDILIATPGRLLDLIQQGFVKLQSIEALVLDEADRMLDMGFLPDVKRIIAKLPTERQTLLFSATMPKPIEQLADAILRNPEQIRIAPRQTSAAKVEQSVIQVRAKAKRWLLADYLDAPDVTRALVFARTKHGADRLTRQLHKSGIPAEAMHGDKSQAARQRTLEAFRSGKTRVVVATDVAARGIDIDGVSHVVNFDLPHEPETYVHRIGRTGRAGATGIAVSFCDPGERKLLVAIERLLGKSLRLQALPPHVAAQAAAELAAEPESEPASHHGKPRPGAPRHKRPAHPAASGSKKKGFQKKRSYQGGATTHAAAKPYGAKKPKSRHRAALSA